MSIPHHSLPFPSPSYKLPSRSLESRSRFSSTCLSSSWLMAHWGNTASTATLNTASWTYNKTHYQGYKHTGNKLTTWPWEQGSWGQYGAQLGSTEPRWVPCWPHELYYLGYLMSTWNDTGIVIDGLVMYHFEAVNDLEPRSACFLWVPTLN